MPDESQKCHLLYDYIIILSLFSLNHRIQRGRKKTVHKITQIEIKKAKDSD